jgi:hypothetical protein
MAQETTETKTSRSAFQKARGILFSLSIVITSAVVLFGLITLIITPPLSSLPDRPYNDLIKAAIDIRIDQSKSVFQLFLIFSGVLAGLLIAKPGEARLVVANVYDITMSACALLLLSLSLVSHLVYIQQVSSAYIVGGALKNFEKDSASMPDVLSDSIDYLFDFQWLFLLAGALVSFLVLLSVHKFKEEVSCHAV